jgi:hypothetical protein
MVAKIVRARPARITYEGLEIVEVACRDNAVESLGELPKALNAAEMDTARSTFRALFGDVKVDRTGTGYADLRLEAHCLQNW